MIFVKRTFVAVLTLLFMYGCASKPPAKAPVDASTKSMPVGTHSSKKPLPVPPPKAPGKVLTESAKAEKTPAEKERQRRVPRPSPARPAPKVTTQAHQTEFQRELEEDTIGTINFHEEKLSNVLKVVSTVMGVNVVANENIANKPITIFLKDVSPRTALEVLCKQNGLWYEEGDDYIRLASVDDFGRIEMASDGAIKRLMFRQMELAKALMMLSERTGRNIVCRNQISATKVTVLMSDVAVDTAIEILCKRYNLWYKHDADSGYTVLMPAEDFGKDMVTDFRPKTRVFNLKYASAPQVAEVIALVMGSRVEYTPPNTLRSYEHLKTDDVEDDEATVDAATADENIHKVVEGPRFSAKAVTSDQIEELVRTRLDYMLTAQDVRRINRDVGFGLIAIFLRNNAVIASSTDESLIEEIDALIADLDTPTPQVLVETKILSVNLSDDFTSFFDLDVSYTSGDDITASFDSTILPPAASNADIFFGYLDPGKWDVDATLQLLKDDGIINIISSPMLVAAQNAEAKAFVGIKDFPLVTGINAETLQDDDGNVTSVILEPVIEKKEIGTSLRITPQINEDRSVTLRLTVSESAISSVKPVIPYYDGEAEQLMDYPVSVVDQEEIITTITVPAGQTLALGGLVNEEDSDVENKVPILGDIPGLGFFFKKKETTKSRTESVVLLTPHIMMTPEESGEVSERALERMEHPMFRDDDPKLFKFNEKQRRLERYERDQPADTPEADPVSEPDS